ncbi:hypothetical protein [Microbulbifer thermotolerans]|uniref:Uncharacterized protein n=1 Tax=Microbulbifer thermotolerans TaxID=252514 RepID=A0AB35HZW5_MICTH|nr:hypothetical protein [Microbulbifer thermotolerans]MCX2795466.1 hypothetical protein [Microbulbifer thermotolerans]MCX2802769.1 hypothetical protein [Microbulbifer thermotolerans]MCX2832857.1 hypothetical protein [Microbulbifer thermotolerans]MCX2836436.1 hypothetical protein [Microbulbifer thermotolerans]SFC53801.1 hypothetical protein SAMN05660479_01883 [Microbulbifer thermotolerans]
MPNIKVAPYSGIYDDRLLVDRLVEIGISISEANEMAEVVVREMGHGFGLRAKIHEHAEKLVNALRATGLEVKWAHG